jgi:hypothetical protein
MTSFESEKLAIHTSAENIFNYLSDFNNFQELMPEQVTNWKSTREECSFTIQGMADLSMKMGSLSEYTKIVYESDGNKPFAFELVTNLYPLNDQSTETQILLNADLNPVLKMMAGRPLQNFVNLLVKKLKEIME